jgi:hypothetical protein
MRQKRWRLHEEPVVDMDCHIQMYAVAEMLEEVVTLAGELSRHVEEQDGEGVEM